MIGSINMRVCRYLSLFGQNLKIESCPCDDLFHSRKVLFHSKYAAVDHPIIHRSANDNLRPMFDSNISTRLFPEIGYCAVF